MKYIFLFLILYIGILTPGMGFSKEIIHIECPISESLESVEITESEFGETHLLAIENHKVGSIKTGLRCQDYGSIKNKLEMISVLMGPLTLVVNSALARKTLLSHALRLGLTTANPVVLAVLVLGGAGFSTLYYVVRLKLEECHTMDRESLLRQVIEELTSSGKLRASKNTKVDMVPALFKSTEGREG